MSKPFGIVGPWVSEEMQSFKDFVFSQMSSPMPTVRWIGDVKKKQHCENGNCGMCRCDLESVSDGRTSPSQLVLVFVHLHRLPMADPHAKRRIGPKTPTPLATWTSQTNTTTTLLVQKCCHPCAQTQSYLPGLPRLAPTLVQTYNSG